MTTLSSKIAALNELADSYDKSIEAQKTSIYKDLKVVLEDSSYLRDRLKALDTSKDFGFAPSEYCEEIGSWIYFSIADVMPKDFQDNEELFLELFKDYMRYEHFVEYFEAEQLLYQSCGFSLIVNENGDVYDQDSGKVVIQGSSYDSELERNELIEAWMEKSGYFPSVFESDRYGNVTLVDTRSKT